MATPGTRAAAVARRLSLRPSPDRQLQLYRNAVTPTPTDLVPYLREGTYFVCPTPPMRLCNGIYVDYPPPINAIPVFRVERAGECCGSCKLQFRSREGKDRHKQKYPTFCPQHKECVADLWKHVQDRSHTRCPICHVKKYDDNGEFLQHYVRCHV